MQILLGSITGMSAGICLGERATLSDILEKIFLRLLLLVILSLVIVSLFVAIAGFSDLKKLRYRAGLTVLCFVLMTGATTSTMPLSQGVFNAWSEL